MFSPDLTPTQHVARREALAQVTRRGDLGESCRIIDEDIVDPIRDQFLDGHRLSGTEFKGVVNRLREVLSGFGPAVLNEANRSPTRTRPKGEEHEFSSLVRGASIQGRGGYEIGGITLHVSRRRLNYSLESSGTYITRHLLERSIERGLASWTGRLAEVEDTVLDTMGLAAVWKRAFEAGMTTDRRVALPYGSGLIYGVMVPEDRPRPSGYLVVSGSRLQSVSEPNPFLAHPRISANSSTDVVLRTAIDGDSLSLDQCDLRDALARFCSAHEDILSSIRRGALWRRSVLTPPRPYDEMAPHMDTLAERLVSFLGRPGPRNALRGRKEDAMAEEYACEDVSSPGPR